MMAVVAAVVGSRVGSKLVEERGDNVVGCSRARRMGVGRDKCGLETPRGN